MAFKYFKYDLILTLLNRFDHELCSVQSEKLQNSWKLSKKKTCCAASTRNMSKKKKHRTARIDIESPSKNINNKPSEAMGDGVHLHHKTFVSSFIESFSNGKQLPQQVHYRPRLRTVGALP